MILITNVQYPLVKPLFTGMDIHLPVTAGLAGAVPVTVHVDRLDDPQAALLVTDGRHYLAGNPAAPGLALTLRQHYLEEIFPNGLAAGKEGFTLHFPEGSWQAVVEEALASKTPILNRREYYESAPVGNDWRFGLPAGYEFRTVTPALIEEPFEGLNELREEMCSERPSVDEFFAHSFGLAPVYAGSVIGWCLSEYNCGDRCEVGIAIHPPHQRQGLATLLTHAFMEMAHVQGILRIGWHCWQSNTPSSATALRAGLHLVSRYPVLMSFFDPVLNLAVTGNLAFHGGDFAGALEWFQRAFAAGAAFPWAFFNAACTAARLGQTGLALSLLSQALDHGYNNRRQLESNEHLADLRSNPAFTALIERL